MKNALLEGHRDAGPAKIRKCFIEWSEGLSFTVEVKRRGFLSRATQASIGRTYEARRPVGLCLNAGFFDACATRSQSGVRVARRGYGPSLNEDLFGPEWEMTNSKVTKGLAGSIDSWLRTFKVR